MTKKTKWVFGLLFSFLVVTQVVPTLAENISASITGSSEVNTGDQGGESQDSNSDDNAQAEEPGAEFDSSPTNESQAPEPSSSESSAPQIQSRPPPPPHATENQWMYIQVPSSIRVDPRAYVTFLPQSTIASLTTTMICINSETLKFDVGMQRSIDDIDRGYLVISGDMTNSVIIAGDSGTINNSLLSSSSLRIFSDVTPIGSSRATFKFVDVSSPTLNESLCNEGRQSNVREIQIIPLGLNQSISKTQLDLGKRG